MASASYNSNEDIWHLLVSWRKWVDGLVILFLCLLAQEARNRAVTLHIAFFLVRVHFVLIIGMFILFPWHALNCHSHSTLLLIYLLTIEDSPVRWNLDLRLLYRTGMWTDWLSVCLYASLYFRPCVVRTQLIFPANNDTCCCWLSPNVLREISYKDKRIRPLPCNVGDASCIPKKWGHGRGGALWPLPSVMVWLSSERWKACTQHSETWMPGLLWCPLENQGPWKSPMMH